MKFVAVYCSSSSSLDPHFTRTAEIVGREIAARGRTLVYGGIFSYPATAEAPKGKLRLLYECNPMAFIIEQAGGKATTGHQRILDIVPEAIHQRVPIYLGSSEDVDDLLACFKECAIEGN